MSTFSGRTSHSQLATIAQTSNANTKIKRYRLIASHPNRSMDRAQAKLSRHLTLKSWEGIPENCRGKLYFLPRIAYKSNSRMV